MTEFRPGRFQILPPIVKNLLIINALVMFLTYVMENMGIDVVEMLGLHYWRSPHFRPWQLVTHIFMHGNFMHLFSNMFALWIFGSVLENVWGGKRFLTFYMICGLGAALLHMAVLGYEFRLFENAFYEYQQTAALDTYIKFIESQNLDRIAWFQSLRTFWESNPSCGNCVSQSIEAINMRYLSMINQPTVGASGAVFGILFAFGYLFPNTLLYIYFLVPVKAKYVVAAYALFELMAGIRNSAGDNIAHFAHLGGMLVAFIILKIWSRHVRNRFY